MTGRLPMRWSRKAYQYAPSSADLIGPSALTPEYRLAWNGVDIVAAEVMLYPMLATAPFEGGIAFRDAVPAFCFDDWTWQQEALRLFQETDPHERGRESLPRPADPHDAGLAYILSRSAICFPRQRVLLAFGGFLTDREAGNPAWGPVASPELRALRRRLFPILAPAFEKSTPDWALASIGDLWLADARSLVAERPLQVRDRFFLRSVDGRALGEDPRLGDVVLLHGRRREVVSGVEHATHSYTRGNTTEDGR